MLKTLVCATAALFAIVSPALALAGECRDALSIPSGETFCLDGSEMTRRGRQQCASDPLFCPGMFDKATEAAHFAIHDQCYDAAGRRTDAEAKSKCSKVWR